MRLTQIAAAGILTLALLSQTLPLAIAAPDVFAPSQPAMVRQSQPTRLAEPATSPAQPAGGPVQPATGAVRPTGYEPQPQRPGSNSQSGYLQIAYTAEDRELLARLIHAEAGGEPFLGQVAVGAVVLNRVKSRDYPDTISQVIYQSTYDPDTGLSYAQFQVVSDGRIYEPADATAYQAADRALAGEDPTGGATGFYNPQKTRQWWVVSQKVAVQIGNHVFFK